MTSFQRLCENPEIAMVYKERAIPGRLHLQPLHKTIFLIINALLPAQGIETETPQKPQSGFEELEWIARFFDAQRQKMRYNSSKK
jgi:hypothetical protein